MDFMMMFVILGVVGGAYVAYLIAKLNREAPRPQAPVSPRQSRLDTDMINMAHIRVAGIGGLGLVVMSIVVAFYLPVVGMSIAAGLLFGAALSLWWIARRRKMGPMPSSGRRPGANIVLSIDEREPPSSGDKTPRDSARSISGGLLPSDRIRV